MSEEVKKEVTTTEETQERLFRQEDVDRIIAERLAREREKYKDYEELKKAKQRLDEIENMNKTEIEKAKAEVEQLKKLLEEKEREKYNIEVENLKLHLLDLAGLPKSWAKRVLGETEEEIKSDIEELKKMLGEKNVKVGERVSGEQGLPDFNKMSQAEYEAWVKEHRKK